MPEVIDYIPGNFIVREGVTTESDQIDILRLAHGFPDTAGSFGTDSNVQTGVDGWITSRGLGYWRWGVGTNTNANTRHRWHQRLPETPAAAVNFPWGFDWVLNFKLLEYSLDSNGHLAIGFGDWDEDAGVTYQSIRTDTDDQRVLLIIEQSSSVVTWYLIACNGSAVSSTTVTSPYAEAATTGIWLSLLYRAGNAFELYVNGAFNSKVASTLPTGSQDDLFLHSAWRVNSGAGKVEWSIGMIGLMPILPDIALIPP